MLMQIILKKIPGKKKESYIKVITVRCISVQQDMGNKLLPLVK